MNDKRLLKSYVWHGDECFFVSTIERDATGVRITETIAWEYDYPLRARRKQVAEVGGRGDGFIQHLSVCRELFETGKYVHEWEREDSSCVPSDELS